MRRQIATDGNINNCCLHFNSHRIAVLAWHGTKYVKNKILNTWNKVCQEQDFNTTGERTFSTCIWFRFELHFATTLVLPLVCTNMTSFPHGLLQVATPQNDFTLTWFRSEEHLGTMDYTTTHHTKRPRLTMCKLLYVGMSRQPSGCIAPRERRILCKPASLPCRLMYACAYAMCTKWSIICFKDCHMCKTQLYRMLTDC